MFTSTIEHHGPVVRLMLAGRLDICVQDDLDRVLTDATSGCPQVLSVDLGGLEFIDSHAVGILVKTRYAAAAAGCRFNLTNACGQVLHVLTTLGVFDALTPPADAPRPKPHGPSHRPTRP